MRVSVAVCLLFEAVVGQVAGPPSTTSAPTLSPAFIERCGSSSVASIPGCWGVPGCAYVRGSGGHCDQDYCNCGGTPAPLLTATLSGINSTNCNYRTQPKSSQCPTSSAVASGTGEVTTAGIAGSTAGTGAVAIAGGSGSLDGTTALPSALGTSGEVPIQTGNPEGESSQTGSVVALGTANPSNPTIATQDAVSTQPSPPLDASTGSQEIAPTGTFTLQPQSPSTQAVTGTPSVQTTPPAQASTNGTQAVIGIPFPQSSPPAQASATSTLSGFDTGVQTLEQPTRSEALTQDSTPEATGHTNEPSETNGDPSTTGATIAGALAIITGATDAGIVTITSIDPSITTNTVISTSDDHHPPGLYPIIIGGSSCWFCPPGSHGSGFILWNWNKPGIYPPPVPGPFPGLTNFPSLTIGPNLLPTPAPEAKPDGPKPDQPSVTKKPTKTLSTDWPSTTSKSSSTECSEVTASSCSVVCSTTSGAATHSCSTTCSTSTGCSATDTATTTTTTGSCRPFTHTLLPAGKGPTRPPKAIGYLGEDEPDSTSVGATGGMGENQAGTSQAPSVIESKPPASSVTSAVPTSNIPLPDISSSLSYSSSPTTVRPPEATPAPPLPETTTPPAPVPSPEPPSPVGLIDPVGTFPCKPGHTILSSNAVLGAAPLVRENCICKFDLQGPWLVGGRPGGKCCDKKCDGCTNKCRPKSKRGSVPVTFIGDGRPQQISDKHTRRNLLHPIPLDLRDASHFIGDNALMARVINREPTWKEFATKGTKLWKALLEKPLEDEAQPEVCDLEEYFDLQPRRAVLNSQSKSILQEPKALGKTDSYIELLASGPREDMAVGDEDEETANFDNTVSVNDGVFMAQSNDRGGIKDTAGKFLTPPTPYRMSQVAWWQWHTAVMITKAKDAEGEPDYSRLKYFFRMEIDNPDTVTIIREALKDNGGSGPFKFTPEDKDESANPFWALLGSPNGRGIVHFLTDHKKSMKGKSIESVSIHFRNGWYYMWATLTPIRR